MVKYGVVLVIFFTIIASINAACVMQGVCGRRKDHVCRPDRLHFLRATRRVTNYCPKFSRRSDVCCNDEQVKMLERGLDEARRWLGGECYGLMREMFCHMHCSPNQDKFVSDVVTDRGRVMSFTYIAKESDVNNLWNACKDKTYLGFRLVNKVCINQPCNAKEFIRSLGTQKSKGGKSPFQINFKFA